MAGVCARVRVFSLMVNLTSDNTNATTDTPINPCSGTFNPFECMAGQLDTEHQFLALIILALSCALCVLCALVCVLTMLVHKISAVWMSAAFGKVIDKEDSNDARKGLLGGGTVKSSFSSASARTKAEGKKKKASFAEDTSCAPPRDIDEEDL